MKQILSRQYACIAGSGYIRGTIGPNRLLLSSLFIALGIIHRNFKEKMCVTESPLQPAEVVLICGCKFTLMVLERHLLSPLSCYVIECGYKIWRAVKVSTHFACKLASWINEIAGNGSRPWIICRESRRNVLISDSLRNYQPSCDSDWNKCSYIQIVRVSLPSSG